MLESAEIGHCVAKDIYAREEPRLRESLLLAQFDEIFHVSLRWISAPTLSQSLG